MSRWKFGAGDDEDGDVTTRVIEPAASEPDEGALVLRAQRDLACFSPLYEAHYDDVLSFVFRRCLNVSLAEEITSRTFFKALRGLPRYRHSCPFRFWLYRIALNELRMHWRQARRWAPSPDDPMEDIELSRVRFAEDAGRAELMERFVHVKRLMDKLPPRYAQALALRYFEELSYEEIGTVMGERLSTVKSLLHRGIKRLRKLALREEEVRGKRGVGDEQTR